MIAFSLLITSCEKEIEEEVEPATETTSTGTTTTSTGTTATPSIYDVKIIDLTAYAGDGSESVIKPFSNYDLEIDFKKVENEWQSYVHIGQPDDEYTFSSHRNNNGTNEYWVKGENPSEMSGVLWCTGMSCYFEEGAEYFPIKASSNGVTYYGWIKVTLEAIEIRINKTAGEYIVLGEEG